MEAADSSEPLGVGIVKDEDFVVIKYGENRRLVQIQAGKSAFIAKEKVLIDEAIGKPFGSIFELNDKKLTYIESQNAESLKLKPQIEVEPVNAQDNRSLVDDGKSQKLSKDEIEKLKSTGLDSTEIVKTIVENSATFKEKTVFSQEKYIKKKQLKYNKVITILHPTIRLLSEMYFDYSPSKIRYMRIDSLSQMLSYGNVVNGRNYIVVDDCLGLLVAAVLNRISEEGHVIQVYPGQGPVGSYRESIHALNISKEKLKKTLHGIPFGKALDVLTVPRDIETENQSEVKMESSSGNDQELGQEDEDEQMSCKEEVMKVEEETEETSSSESPRTNKRKNNYSSKTLAELHLKKEERNKRKEERLVETKIAVEILEKEKIDGLLITCNHHPSSVLLPLMPFLGLSRPFVVHSMYLQSLVDCYKKLKESEEAIFLNITESWMRSYQVLTDRTHPFVNMSNSGGYLLTGIKVAKPS